MTLIPRVRNILLSPKAEWDTIQGETETIRSLLVKYVVPLALIGPIALFIRYGLVGFDAILFRIGGPKWGFILALNSFLASIISYFVCTFVIDALAPTFSSEKNIGRSAQLVAYSFTAFWVAGIFYLIPALNTLVWLLSLYGVYLFYLGILPLKHTPEDKRVGYIVVSIIVIILVMYVVDLAVGEIVFAISGNPFTPAGL